MNPDKLNKSDKTITNLGTLRKARDVVMLELKESYSEKITPFVEIILKVMKANNINEFAAIAKIKNELPIYKEPGAELFFGCAITEIIDEKYFVGFER
jgi:hypothetical protein